MKPLISVVTAVYNTEKYLDKAVQSVLNQTFRNFEYVIVDDGSTDGSYEILQDYAKKHPDIVRLYKQENRGAYPAYNKCTELAEGQYIMTLNSDDYLSEDCLEIVSSYVMDYSVDVVFINTTTHIADIDQNIIERDTSSSLMKEEFVNLDQDSVRANWPVFFRLGLVKNNINLYKTELMKKHPYRTDWYGADYILNIDMANDIKSVACHPKNLYHNFTYTGGFDERKNLSRGKYNSYEHEMFNTFYLKYKELFSSWDILTDDNIKLLASDRLSCLITEFIHINAWNNNMSILEIVERLISYFDDVLIEASEIMDLRNDTEKKIINYVNQLHVKALDDGRLQDSSLGHWLLIFIKVFTDKGYPDDLRSLGMQEALLNEYNPYCLGLAYFEDYCKTNPSEENRDFLDYMKTRERARAYILTGKYDLAADEIALLFSTSAAEPEKYLLLAMNCLSCDFIEDAKEAVEMGLERFPNYQRLIGIKERIDKTHLYTDKQ